MQKFLSFSFLVLIIFCYFLATTSSVQGLFLGLLFTQKSLLEVLGAPYKMLGIGPGLATCNNVNALLAVCYCFDPRSVSF